MQRRTILSAIALPCVSLARNSGAASMATHPAERAKPLFARELPNAPGRTFTSIIVTFPPGARAAPHLHGNAFVYAYVLEGAVRSQLDDQPAAVYRAGDSWEEEPGARHKVTENMSSSRPARLLVVFISTTGDPLKVPDSE